MRVLILFSFLLSVAAFAPTTRVTRSAALSMDASNLIGAPVKGESPTVNTLGYFDPLGLADGKDDSTLAWYRAAELKHGRVCMLAALGIFVQSFATIPGFPIQDNNAFTAVKSLYYENPSAAIQIILSIAAVEVLCASIENQSERPGDFGWDPLNIRPKDEEALDKMQVKELKNGRLAMLSVAGMAYQSALTGQGTWEQLASGHISPFGDGQGIF